MTRPPLGVRLLAALRHEPDWAAMSAETSFAGLAAFRDAENRRRASPLIRVITGFPDRRAAIGWQQVTLPGREVRIRVYRPHAGPPTRPLVLHVHGGGFVGTAPQSDWINSHLAARLPATVVSVEHRLLAPGTPLSAAADDAWDVLRHVLEHPDRYGADPDRAAVLGESAGGAMAALAAQRARAAGLTLRAQVLVNPCTDVTATALSYPSVREHAAAPGLTRPQLELFLRLAVPDGADARSVSPLYADDLGGLPPALIVVPAIDPVADHGRVYAERLRAAGTPVELAEHPGAVHAFVSTPRIVPQARAARARITAFLRERLG